MCIFCVYIKCNSTPNNIFFSLTYRHLPKLTMIHKATLNKSQSVEITEIMSSVVSNIEKEINNKNISLKFPNI